MKFYIYELGYMIEKSSIQVQKLKNVYIPIC